MKKIIGSRRLACQLETYRHAARHSCVFLMFAFRLQPGQRWVLYKVISANNSDNTKEFSLKDQSSVYPSQIYHFISKSYRHFSSFYWRNLRT